MDYLVCNYQMWNSRPGDTAALLQQLHMLLNQKTELVKLFFSYCEPAENIYCGVVDMLLLF